MGQYFRIINENKEQYLEPFSMPCSERFPNIIQNDLMTRCVAWLVCSSVNSKFKFLKKNNFYSDKYLGSWSGDKIVIIGDSDEEELSHHVCEFYKDITFDVIAMLFELDDDLIQRYIKNSHNFEFLAKVALLENAPNNLIHQITESYGKTWKQKYYKSLNNE